ncbi:MAG: recombinase family protein [Gemmataceae bacterium]|nr:recombinase family protein [Gemmataceae bacterium]
MNTANQQSWWVKEQTAAPPPVPRLRGVAYYRHSAKDRQENSVAIQQELVQKWAKENGVDIIHEFADRGKSGLTAEGRDPKNPEENAHSDNGDSKPGRTDDAGAEAAGMGRDAYRKAKEITSPPGSPRG